MEMRTLGKTGLAVSALGFGGGPVGFLNEDQKTVTKILNTALDRGINLIDTAAVYFKSEEMIGEAIGHRRDEFVLVSKCGHAQDEFEGEAWSGEVVTQTVDRALRRLRTDHLDVMLIHGCPMEALEKGDAIGALVRARDAGKIRHVGLSADNDEALYAVRENVIEVLETSVNICDQANIDTAVTEAQANDIGVIVKRPIANAAWRTAAEQPGVYATYAETYSERLAAMAITPDQLGFDGDVATAWPEIALRFTLSQPGVTTAIVGTTKESNVDRNVAILAKGPLPVGPIKKLRDAFKRAESASGETWLALR